MPVIVKPSVKCSPCLVSVITSEYLITTRANCKTTIDINLAYWTATVTQDCYL